MKSADETLNTAIRALLAAQSWEDQKVVLSENRNLLLTNEANQKLENALHLFIHDSSVVNQIKKAQILLQRCHNLGIEKVLASKTEQLSSGSAVMRPRARIISILGEELISDEAVALVELVKNAYDADATKVEIRFEFHKDQATSIIVTDNGIGMSMDTVLNSWFEPGTPSKRKIDISPRGRIYQGAKGIGRFAAARLAETLLLESKPESQDHIVVVLVDWGKFDEDSYLDRISIDYDVHLAPSNFCGTRLTLNRLRKVWNKQDYETLHVRLSRLISPFEEVSDFEIEVTIPGFPQFSGKVEPPNLVKRPIYLLQGVLDEKGSFSGTMFYNDVEHKTFNSIKLGERGQIPSCGSFDVEIRAWDRDREGLVDLIEQLKQGIQEIRRILNNFSGVSIYRDGFRVYPYGQKGNDWLGLDNRSRQNPGTRLANNQIISSIKISRENNPELQDRSNREGMILNAAHQALENWFTEILALLEAERYKLRPRRKDKQKEHNLFEPLDISEIVKIARHELGDTHALVRMLTETEEEVRSGVERVQEVFSRLLVSAGLGQMIDIVTHEIGAPLGKIYRQLGIIEESIANCADEKTKQRVTDIRALLDQIHTLRQRLDPQTAGKRGKATTFYLQEAIEDNFNLYEALIIKQNIKYEIVPVNIPLRLFMSRSSLDQIMTNLIDNSIYWLIKEKGRGNGGYIRVHIELLNHGFSVVFSDNGPGVSEEFRQQIFEPYFSTKSNGIGLGLYIARLVIEPYGTLSYHDDCELPGACFKLSFERGVGL